jgi:death-on-curing protein
VITVDDEDDVLYLEIEDILGLYADLFGCTDQEAADQLRSQSGLESVLDRPRTYAYYQHADLSLQAAVLAHGIAEGQYFIEGNKRVALESMRTFLLINGYQLTASQEDRAAWILDLSEGGTAEELGERIRAALMPSGLG